MAVTRSYSFGFEHFFNIQNGDKDVDFVGFSSGFAANTTHETHSDLDFYDSTGVFAGSGGSSLGVDPAIARFTSGNLVTVAEQGGDLVYEVNTSTGTFVRTGAFGYTNASDADVGVLRSGLISTIDNRFVTAMTRSYSGSDTDVYISIRNSNGAQTSGFAVDASITADDGDARIAMLAGKFGIGTGGIINETGGFAVMFDRAVPNPTSPGSIPTSTNSLMYAVYNADGSVRKAPTTIVSGGISSYAGDITAAGDGFAMTWIDGNGDLKLRLLDKNGNTTLGGATTTILADPAASGLLRPTITTLSNGYISVAVETAHSELGQPTTFGKMLVMVSPGIFGLSVLYAEDYILGGNLHSMDSAGFGVGEMVVGGQDLNGTQASAMVVEGRRTSTGDGANDTITGDDLVDSMNGGGGDDTLSGAGNADGLSGGDGNDYVDGGADNDFLYGNAGNDKLIGASGVDTMTGGAGNDTYYVDNAGDKVIEGTGEGTADWVATSVSYVLGAGVQVEKLSTTNTGLTTAINLTGNAFVQAITGNAGANKLNGMGGADTMTGLGGNDTYYIDNAGDKVIEGAGQGTADWVAASVSYTLGAGVQVEKLSTTNTGLTTAIDLTGNAFAQSITGNAGANRLNGMGGADTMTGLGGNDTYYVDNAGDKVVEGAGQGTADWVATSVSYILSATAQVERFSTTNSGATTAINLVGNQFGQIIGGNAGANIISGKAGNDTLSGAGGADVFVFDTALNATTNVDRITDFNVAADTIWLQNSVFTHIAGTGMLAAAQFYKSTAGVAHDANDHILYDTDSGFLYYDANGNAAGGSVHFATLAPNLALTNADFTVI